MQAINYGQELLLVQSTTGGSGGGATGVDDWLPIGAHLRHRSHEVGRSSNIHEGVRIGGVSGIGNSSESRKGEVADEVTTEVTLKDFEIDVYEGSGETDWNSLLSRVGNTKSSSGGSHNAENLSLSSRDDDEASSFALQNREHEICDTLCGRVRLLCVQKLADALHAWVPALYKYVLLHFVIDLIQGPSRRP
jgi:hypothetical protein